MSLYSGACVIRYGYAGVEAACRWYGTHALSRDFEASWSGTARCTTRDPHGLSIGYLGVVNIATLIINDENNITTDNVLEVDATCPDVLSSLIAKS